MEIKLTIFTPTYNRAHTLPRLYVSLRKQTRMDFEWLVINDGSTDNTDELFDSWMKEDCAFPIRYQKVENGGKNRAINRAMDMAQGTYFMILDSDDMLIDDAVEQILVAFQGVDNEHIIGISKKRGNLEGKPLKLSHDIPDPPGYVECSNLERAKYGLDVDMAEVFYTDKLKKYHFPVWPGEKFTPEEVVWNRMALDGYKLRWYDQVIYLCEYQEGGLSDSTWRLQRDNPMGYAMMWNVRLEYTKDFRMMVNYTLQYISCCLLANEAAHLFKCVRPVLATMLLPFGWLLSVRRRKQFKSLC